MDEAVTMQVLEAVQCFVADGSDLFFPQWLLVNCQTTRGNRNGILKKYADRTNTKYVAEICGNH